MPDDITVTTIVYGTAAFVANKLFGSTLDTIGGDLNSAYKTGRDKLLAKAAAKVVDPGDGKSPNLRVARDVLWNGAITDNEVCAEYFGGILAASRSGDGSDDSALHYLDVIKSLSAKQLHLHYCIYRAIQKRFIADESQINVGLQSELARHSIFMSTRELDGLGMAPVDDLTILARTGILASWTTSFHKVDEERGIPYLSCGPTTFGCMLYAIAFNRFADWRKFSTLDFGEFADVKSAVYASKSLDEFVMQATGQSASADSPAIP